MYIFADEAGNLDFSPKGSKYFLVCALVAEQWEPIGQSLLGLRHQLAIENADIFDYGFHASEDKQVVRDRVFDVLSKCNFDIHAVLMEKRKTRPSIATSEEYFYQLSWHFLFKYLVRRYSLQSTPCLVTASSLGTKSKKTAFRNALGSVLAQHGGSTATPAFWTAASHPCLQAADYCAWAIQRFFERQDKRSYVLIESKIQSCFEPFQQSTTLYY
ncbi:MAG: DUF3800 domain-containing protein [Candidatus Obscuribacterales bacterium]